MPAHEDARARDWLDYTLRLMWSTYPVWGGAPGGWHEGPNYWASYMGRMVPIVIEAWQKPLTISRATEKLLVMRIIAMDPKNNHGSILVDNVGKPPR